MGMRVRTQQELNTIQEQNLITEGVYLFKVRTASDEYSKSGNYMIKILLEIETSNGIKCLYDYLVDIDSMAFKIKHFCETTGLNVSNFEAIDCIDQVGEVEIKIIPSQNGYPPQNKVVDYVTKKNNIVESQENKASKFNKFDDEIPF